MKAILSLFARRFSPQNGWRLFLNPQISAGKKFLAVVLALAATGALIVMEVPLEAALAALLPGAGLILDVAIDGLEVLLLPALLSGSLLSLLATSQARSLPPVVK